MAVGWIMSGTEMSDGGKHDVWRRTEKARELTGMHPDKVVLDADTVSEFRSIRRGRLNLPGALDVWSSADTDSVCDYEYDSAVVNICDLDVDGSGSESKMIACLETLMRQESRTIWMKEYSLRGLLSLRDRGDLYFRRYTRSCRDEWALSPELVAAHMSNGGGGRCASGGSFDWLLALRSASDTVELRREQMRLSLGPSSEPSLKHKRHESAWLLFSNAHMMYLTAEAADLLPSVHRSQQDVFGSWCRYVYGIRKHRFDHVLYTLGRYAYMARLEGRHREYVKSIDGFLRALKRLEWGPGRRRCLRWSMVFFADGVGRDVHRVFHPEFIRSVGRFAGDPVPADRGEQRALAKTVRDMSWNQAMS